MSDLSVGGGSQVQNTQIQDAIVEDTKNTTGTGVNGNYGAVPNTPPNSAPIGDIVQSLFAMAPRLSGEQIDILIAEATLKLKELVGKTETNELNAKEEQKRQSLTERTTQLQEAEEKFQEAKKARESGNIFDKIKMAFQMLGALISIAVGAVLVATGAGAAAGAALIAMGVLSLIMTIDSIVQQETGRGMMGHIAGGLAEAFGASEEQADKIAQGFDIAFGVILAVATIVVAVATFRADSVASATAQLAQQVAAISTSATAIASAGVQTVSATKSFQAAKASAEAQEQQADAQELQAFTELLNDFIDQIMNRISGSNQAFNAMLDDVVQSIQDRGDTLSRAKFTG